MHTFWRRRALGLMPRVNMTSLMSVKVKNETSRVSGLYVGGFQELKPKLPRPGLETSNADRQDARGVKQQLPAQTQHCYKDSGLHV